MWPFASKKRPPQTVEQQAVQSPRSRFNPSWKLTYERKRLPGPGTQNYAYENLGLVESTPIGAGTANRLHFRPLQPPQDYAQFATYLQGLGGVAQGTIYGQPLIAPQVVGMAYGEIDGDING